MIENSMFNNFWEFWTFDVSKMFYHQVKTQNQYKKHVQAKFTVQNILHTNLLEGFIVRKKIRGVLCCLEWFLAWKFPKFNTRFLWTLSQKLTSCFRPKTKFIVSNSHAQHVFVNDIFRKAGAVPFFDLCALQPYQSTLCFFREFCKIPNPNLLWEN